MKINKLIFLVIMNFHKMSIPKSSRENYMRFKRLWLDPSDCAYILSMGLKKIFFQESSEIRCIIDF